MRPEHAPPCHESSFSFFPSLLLSLLLSFSLFLPLLFRVGTQVYKELYVLSKEDNEGTRTVGHPVRCTQLAVQVKTLMNFLLE